MTIDVYDSFSYVVANLSTLCFRKDVEILHFVCGVLSSVGALDTVV